MSVILADLFEQDQRLVRAYAEADIGSSVPRWFDETYGKYGLGHDVPPPFSCGLVGSLCRLGDLGVISSARLEDDVDAVVRSALDACRKIVADAN